MEGNNDPPTTQTNGDVRIDGIKELDPGSIKDDDGFDNGDLENCTTACSIRPLNLSISTGTSGIPSC
jgi:hypothetical protein